MTKFSTKCMTKLISNGMGLSPNRSNKQKKKTFRLLSSIGGNHNSIFRLFIIGFWIPITQNVHHRVDKWTQATVTTER